MTSTLQTISLVTLCLGVAFLIAAAVIFVKLKIWVVIADLSGKTAQQSIERLRTQAGQPAPRQRHFSYVANSGAIWRGKGTVRLSKKETEPLGRRTEQTLPLNQMGADPDGTMPLDQADLDGTMPLDQADLDGTMPLDQPDLDGTMPLNAMPDVYGGAAAHDPGATVVMAPEPEPECPVPHGDFVLLEQTVLIHTQEVIPQQSEFHA